MAERLRPVDAVTIGVGMTGSILAKELAAAGLKVVGLERGAERDTVPDFQSPAMHDELRFAIRKSLMMDTTRETMTVRANVDQTALPLRRISMSRSFRRRRSWCNFRREPRACCTRRNTSSHFPRRSGRSFQPAKNSGSS